MLQTFEKEMIMTSAMSSEDRVTKIAGIFSNEEAAENAFDTLNRDSQFKQSNLKQVPPHDPHFDQKIEPEDKNIGKTLLKTHLIFAVGGVVVGILISSLLLFLELSFMQVYVFETYIAISVICLFIAMLAAGFTSIRPDHDPLINDVRKATRAGKWVLIVHTDDSDKASKAKELMQPFAASTTSTF